MIRWLMNNRALTVLRMPSSSAFGTLVLRVATGAIFIAHGWPKLTNMAMTSAFFGRIGIPAPGFFGPFVGVVELVGGICLILGFTTRFWAAGLAIDMLVAMATAQKFASFGAIEFELILGAAALFLFLHGAGTWSVDSRVMRMRRG